MERRPSRSVLTCVFALALVSPAGCSGSGEGDVALRGSGQDHVPTTDAQIVARVDGKPITLEEVQRLAVGQGVVDRAADLDPDDTVFEGVLDDVIMQRVLAREARERRLHTSETAKRRRAMLETRMLANLVIEDQVRRTVTEPALRDLYSKQNTLRETQPQVRGRHILVATEAEALALRDRLLDGEPFAELAIELSQDDSTSADGGRLDWFTRQRYGTDFGDAAFATGKGQISEPVQTEEGWHIVLIDDVRSNMPPTFEELRGELEGFLRREEINRFLSEVRESADIELTYVEEGAENE